MRRIKFRAWDEKNKRMISEIGLFCLSDIDEKLSIQELKEYTVMQYIGLNDINGKEIYEGDVVNCFPWPDDTMQYSRVSVIVWNKGNFSDGDLQANGFYCLYGMWYGTDPLDDDSYGKISTLDNMYVEIIGNVFENPDLFPLKSGTRSE